MSANTGIVLALAGGWTWSSEYELTETYQEQGDIAGVEVKVPADGLEAGELGGEKVFSQYAGVQVHHLKLVL